ncbi:DUF3040 domain-containing protein [Actinomycetospora sp. C-140]
MPMTPPTPDPDPRDGRPLSEREQRVLAGIEASLSVDDPRLSARMAHDRVRPATSLSSRALNRSVQAGVLLLVALLVLPAEWRAALVVVMVMVVPVVAGLWVTRHGEPPEDTENRPPA